MIIDVSSEQVSRESLWLVELAVDEGSKVCELLVGGQGGVEHGGVDDPLLGSSRCVGPPSFYLEQVHGRVQGSVVEVLLLQSLNVLVCRSPTTDESWPCRNCTSYCT